MPVSLVKAPMYADWERELLHNVDIGSLPAQFFQGEGRFRVNTVKFRCNRIGCKRTASLTETFRTEDGHYIVDDPRCVLHNGASYLDSHEGDVRPMAMAVVDEPIMDQFGGITELIIK